jgi:hypothetical protein
MAVEARVCSSNGRFFGGSIVVEAAVIKEGMMRLSSMLDSLL